MMISMNVSSFRLVDSSYAYRFQGEKYWDTRIGCNDNCYLDMTTNVFRRLHYFVTLTQVACL